MKGQQIATKENNKKELAQINNSFDVSPQDIKKFLCPNAADPEISIFVRFCVAKRLDPFAKDVYLIKYEKQPA